MLSEYFAKYPDNDYLSYMNDNKADADLSSVINVLIPDYCDPDLINTVKSMFINAANPQRVRIKVFYQDDNDEMFEELSNMSNVKMKRISPDACRGSAYARYQCSTMVENDTDYVMHVDSHMRCAKFWDVAMITLWKNCNDENAIVSQRSPNFSECYDEPLDSDRWIKEVWHIFNKLRYAGYTDFYGNVLPIPLVVCPNDNSISRQTACISAHTLFIKASTDKIVPFDPYMYFYADENCMALRYWTHGYNIYSPDYYPIFHLYEREETMKKYLNIDLDRGNRVQDDWLRYTVEVERTKALFGLFDRKVDLGRFCLGDKRTLKEYEEYCGVDFKNKKISQYCLDGDVHIKTGETFDIPNPTEEKLNEDIDDVTYKYTREDLIEIWRDLAHRSSDESKGLEKPLIVTDNGLFSLGMLKGLFNALEKAGVEYALYHDVVANPTIKNVNEGLEIYKSNSCDSIVAFGGGSALDCAKTIGALATNKGKTVEKLKGLLHVHKKMPFFIAIPTTAGTGSETTLAAVIVNEVTHHKYAINDPHLIPDVAVHDPKLLTGLPGKITSTTGMDALTHAVEAYIGHSNTRKTQQAALKAVKLIKDNLLESYNDPKNLTYRKNMQEASFLAGVAFTRAYVGYVHAIAHSLGGKYNVPHGLANAIILPYVLESFGEKAYKKLAELSDSINLCDKNETREFKAKAFIKWIREMNAKMDIPDKFDIDYVDKDVEEMAHHAIKEGNPLYPVPRIFSYEDFLVIYRLVLK